MLVHNQDVRTEYATNVNTSHHYSDNQDVLTLFDTIFFQAMQRLRDEGKGRVVKTNLTEKSFIRIPECKNTNT